MRSPLYASRERALLGRAGHQHPCGHGCFCFVPKRMDCLSCRREAFKVAMAQQYAEDGMTVTQILDRRG